MTDYKGVIWVPHIDNADDLQKILQENGINAVAVHSNIKKKCKKNRIGKFKDEEVKILIAVDMLKAGFDASVDYEIIAKKIKNEEDLIQIRGRALRDGNKIKPNNNKVAYIMAFKGSISPNHDIRYAKEDEISTDKAF